MLARGYLTAGAFYPTYAHQLSLVADYLKNVEVVFAIMRQQLDAGSVLSALHGPVAQSGFARLT